MSYSHRVRAKHWRKLHGELQTRKVPPACNMWELRETTLNMRSERTGSNPFKRLGALHASRQGSLECIRVTGSTSCWLKILTLKFLFRIAKSPEFAQRMTSQQPLVARSKATYYRAQHNLLHRMRTSTTCITNTNRTRRDFMQKTTTAARVARLVLVEACSATSGRDQRRCSCSCCTS